MVVIGSMMILGSDIAQVEILGGVLTVHLKSGGTVTAEGGTVEVYGED